MVTFNEVAAVSIGFILKKPIMICFRKDIRLFINDIKKIAPDTEMSIVPEASGEYIRSEDIDAVYPIGKYSFEFETKGEKYILVNPGNLIGGESKIFVESVDDITLFLMLTSTRFSKSINFILESKNPSGKKLEFQNIYKFLLETLKVQLSFKEITEPQKDSFKKSIQKYKFILQIRKGTIIPVNFSQEKLSGFCIILFHNPKILLDILKNYFNPDVRKQDKEGFSLVASISLMMKKIKFMSLKGEGQDLLVFFKGKTNIIFGTSKHKKIEHNFMESFKDLLYSYDYPVDVKMELFVLICLFQASGVSTIKLRYEKIVEYLKTHFQRNYIVRDDLYQII